MFHVGTQLLSRTKPGSDSVSSSKRVKAGSDYRTTTISKVTKKTDESEPNKVIVDLVVFVVRTIGK